MWSNRVKRAVMGGLLCWAISSTATTNNLVWHWNFDEGKDWHDDAFGTVSTNLVALDYFGTANATLTVMDSTNWVSGRQFTALAFDGVNDYLAVTNNLAGTLGGTASLSFWFKTTQTGTSSAGTSPGVAGVAGSGGAQWGWLDNVGRIGLAFDNTTVIQSTNSVADGNWHHVVMTRLSTGARTCTLYVDGVLHASAQGPSGAKSSAFYSLGRIENGATPAYFAGRLDQIHAYSQVLTLTDVQTLFSNHAPKCWRVATEGVTNKTFTTASIYSRTYDVERDTCAVTRWTQPARGTVTYNGDGSFNYTHTPGAPMGTDSFFVDVGDGRGGFHRGTIAVTTMSESASGMPITQYTNFTPIKTNGVDVSFASWRIPRLIDWDLDGDLDLLVGVNGAIWRWTNTGSASAPAFTTRTQVQANSANITAGTGCIALIDMNGNGVKDLVAIDSSRRLILYVNTRAADQSPVYAAGTYVLHSSGSNFVLPESSFDLGDWNGDGLPDLVTGTGSGTIRLYLNVGTAASPRYNDTYSSLVSNSYNLYPRLFDVNGNGKLDFIHGINWGDITYYRDPFDRGLSGANFAVTDSTGGTLDMHGLLNGACVDFGDLNNDGKLDILCGGNGGTDKIFIGYGVLKSVQESLADIEAIYNVDTNNVGITLSANTNLLLNAVNTANWNLIARIQHGTLGAREELYVALTNHIAKYGFLKYQAHDVAKFHHVPSIVLMNWVMLTYAIPDTPTRRIEIANIMGLTNTMRTLYLEQGLAVGDAGTSYAATYQTIRDFQRRHPRELFPDCILTIDQLNGDGRGGFIWTPNSTKNTFGQWALGNANEWAGDLTTAIEKVLGAGKASGDYFTFVMGHEVTHSLDGYVNGRANQDLRKRWGLTLCTAAGPNIIPGANGWWDWTATKTNFQAKGYWDGVAGNWDAAWTAYWETGPGSLYRSLSFMRGNIDWFMGAAQESLATQANHHWANGVGRLIGATDRFRRGSAAGYGPMKANINEVATFIDYLSGGMNRVNLVETKNLGGADEFVNWIDHYADLERDDRGYIQQIKVDGMTFRFALADNGVVTNVFTSLLNVSADDTWTFRNTPCVIDVLANDMRLEGTGALRIVSLTQPANGTAATNGEGTVTYTSTGSFAGFDTFSYTVTSAEGGTATALVRVEVVNPATPSGSLLVEYWNSIGSGTAVSDLTGHANFPMSPSEKYYTNSVFELRKDFRDNYGTRVRALLVPSATGSYKFWIASDDNSELWLSLNHEPANKQRIAYVSDWTGSREWTKFSSQASQEIPLVAGRSYYIETLQKEGGGGDNLAVAWSGPDTYSSTNLIPAASLRHPFSSYVEKKSVQWFKNGSGLWDTVSSNWTVNGTAAATFFGDDAVALPDISGLSAATLTLVDDYLLSAFSVPAQMTAYTVAGDFALQTPSFAKAGTNALEMEGSLTVTADPITNLSGTVTIGTLIAPGLSLAQQAQATFGWLSTPSLVVAQDAQATITQSSSQVQGATISSGGLLVAPAGALLATPSGAGTWRLSSGIYRFGNTTFNAGTLDLPAGARGESLYAANMPLAALSGPGTFAFVSESSSTVDPVPGNPAVDVSGFFGTLRMETLGAMRVNAFSAANWKTWFESFPASSTLWFGKGIQYFGPVCTLNSRLAFEDNAQVANTYQDSGGSFGQWRFGAGTAVFNNALSLGTNSHIRLGNHEACTIICQGPISGTNSVLEFGSGYPSLSYPLEVHLMADNTHAYTQIRNSGNSGRVTLHAWHPNALGNALRSVTSGSSGACVVNIGASTTAVDVVVASLEGTNSADTVILAHPDSSLLINGAGTSAFSGVIAGSGALLKTGSGALTLAGNNTLGVFSFTGGTVVPKHVNALGTNSLLTLGGTCVFDLTQAGAVVPTAPLALTLTETPSLATAYNATTDMTLASVSGPGQLTLSVDVAGLASFGEYKLLNSTALLSSNAFHLVLSQALPDHLKASLKCSNDGVYLRVTPVTVAVTLDAQGGAVSPGTTNLLYEAAYGVLPVPVNAAYDFDGWWTEPGGQGMRILPATVVTNLTDHTLYARWTEPVKRGGVISVNFGSDRAALEPVSERVGLSPVPAKYWINMPDAGNTGGLPSTLVATNLQDGAMLAQVGSQLSVCSRGGTWSAGNTSNQTGRLLYGYLDDSNGSNPAGFKVTGIPYLKYRVYIYRNNDAGADTTNRFGYHTVNGTAYSYINGVLAPGSTADWGVTRYAALIEGENVMRVDNLTGDLTVLTASPGNGVRGCISGFQIESMADAISVKVGASGNFVIPNDNGTNYAGVASLGIKCSRWNNMTGNDETLTIVKSCTSTNSGVTVTVDAAQAAWGPAVAHSAITNGHANTKLLGRYMDLSSGNQYTITVTGIPFACYTVYMIFSGDGGVYSPASINGVNYCGLFDTTISGTATWGNRNATWSTLQSACGDSYLKEGYNYLRVTGLTNATLTLRNTISSNRGTLAGFQIVEAADVREEGELTWIGGSSGSWNDASNWSTAAIPSGADTVLFYAPATVNLGGSGAATVRKIKMAGNMLTLTNGTFAGAPSLVNCTGGTTTLSTDSAIAFDAWPVNVYKDGLGMVRLNSIAYGPSDLLRISGAGGIIVTNGGTIGTLSLESAGSTFEASGGALSILTAFKPQAQSNFKVTGSAVLSIASAQTVNDVNYEFSGSSQTSVTGQLHFYSYGDVLFKDSAKVLATGKMAFNRDEKIEIQGNAELQCTQFRFHDEITGGYNTTLTMNGGKVNAIATGIDKNSAFHFAHWNYGNSRFYLNGGELVATNGSGNMSLGVDGSSYVYLGGAQIKVKRFQPATSSEFYMTNGVLNVGVSGVVNAGTKPLYLAGGTVAAWDNWSSAKAMTLTNTVAGLGVPGDVAFDTAGYTISLTGPIDGEGGLIKSGAGTLSLGGANSYMGITAIQAGTVIPKHVTAFGTGALALEGGTLDLTASGAVVPTGTKAWTVSGTPTVKLTYSAANKMSISGVTGSGVASLSVEVSAVSSLGAYKLISTTTDVTTNNFALALTGNPAGFAAELTSAADGLYMNVTALPAVAWNVDGDGVWNTSTPNWSKNGVGGVTFTDNDFAILPDRAGVGAATLTLAAPYSTASLTVSATNTAYTLAGAPLTAARAVLFAGSSLALTNEGSRITENVALPQNTTLTVPGLSALPASFTPAAGDYPNQARLRLANGGPLTSLAEVAGKDAQVILAKAVNLGTEYTVSGGQTLAVENGGSITATTNLFVARDNRMIVSGGSVAVAQHLWLNTFNVGGRGRLDVTGGALSVAGDIRDNRDSLFEVVQTGGQVTCAALRAQQVSVAGQNYGGAAGNNTYTLAGGTLTVGGMQGGNGVDIWSRGLALYLGGGTLRASASFTVNANTILLTGVNGNTVLDTQANTLTIDWPVTGSGGFTKIGSGTLELRGNNAFSGSVSMNAGTLYLSATNAMTALTVYGGTVVPRHLEAFGPAQIDLAGGTLDVRAAGAVVPLKTVNVLAASTLKTTFALPANLTVGSMGAVLTLHVDISGAPIPGECKLLKASAIPGQSAFALETSGGGNCMKLLVFKEDGVYLRLVRWGTLYLFQ